MYIVSFLVFITICFLTYDRNPKRFAIQRLRFIIFLISVAIIILWYIDNESGRFASGVMTVAMLGISFYWVLMFICNVLNFGAKLHSYYQESQQKRVIPSFPIPQEMTIREAREILNVRINATKQEIINAYVRLIANNDLSYGGSSYIGIKIENAKRLLLNG